MNLPRVLRKLPISVACFLLVAHPVDIPAIDTQSTVVSNTAFAFELYSDLAKTPGNIFFSPYSISAALAMTYGGARGETAKQIAKALHFSKTTGETDLGFAHLQVQLNRLNRPKTMDLSIANALWSQKGHPFLPAFLAVAKNNYQANVNQADFTTGGEIVRGEINHWVETQTRSRIHDALPPGSIGAVTRLVLVNAIYFKGAWINAFNKIVTRSEPFHISRDKSADVQLMHQTASVRYAQASDFQAVELPYVSEALAMVILLPREIDGCAALENRLSPMFIWRVISLMKEQEVEIFLPRFKIESSRDLNSTLSKRGMLDPFDVEKADFSGMDGASDLFLSGVYHKAWVEVTEQGTEAAAVTSISAPTSSAAQPQGPPVFRADHPFVFFIRDTRSGSILFVGRFAQPSPN
jgi:serpin B